MLKVDEASRLIRAETALPLSGMECAQAFPHFRLFTFSWAARRLCHLQENRHHYYPKIYFISERFLAFRRKLDI
jgi:hypothetical protein